MVYKKVICIREITDIELVIFNRTKMVNYTSPILNRLYFISEPINIFEATFDLTIDKHYFIWDNIDGSTQICTIPENKINDYFITNAENRNKRIDEILK